MLLSCNWRKLGCLFLVCCILLSGIPISVFAENAEVLILSPDGGAFLEYAKPVTIRVIATTMPTLTAGGSSLTGVEVSQHEWDFAWTPNILGTVTLTATADGLSDSRTVCVSKTRIDDRWAFSQTTPLFSTARYLMDFGTSSVTYDNESVKLSNTPSFHIRTRTDSVTDGAIVYEFDMAINTDNDGTEFVLSHRSHDNEEEPLMRLKNGTVNFPAEDRKWTDCYTKNVWSTYKLVFDCNAKTYHIYQDGVLLRPAIGMTGSMLDSIDALSFACANNTASSLFQVSFRSLEIRREEPKQAQMIAPAPKEVVEVGQVTDVVISGDDAVSKVEVFANGIRTLDGVYDQKKGGWVSPWIPTEAGTTELIALLYRKDGTSFTSESVVVTVMESEVLASCNFTVADEYNGALYIPHGRRFWNVAAGEIVDADIDGIPSKASKLSSNGTKTMGWQFATRTSYDNNSFSDGNKDAPITEGILVYEWKMKHGGGRLDIKDRQPATANYNSELYFDIDKTLGYLTGNNQYVRLQVLGNDWYQMKLVLNLNTWTKSIYMDGICIAENVGITTENASDAKIGGVWFTVTNGDVYLADIKIRHIGNSAKQGTLTFITPEDNASFDLGKSTYLKVQASKEIQSVAFYQNNTLLGRGIETPIGSGIYEFPWSPSVSGIHTLSAKANTGAESQITLDVIQYEWTETDTKLDFNAIPTNAQPYGVLADPKIATQVAQPDASIDDKALKVIKLNQESYIDVPMLASAADMVLSFDYLSSDTDTARKISMIGLAEDNHSLVESPAFTIGTDGNVTTANGTKVTTLGIGTWYRFDLLYHFGSKTFDLYMNGAKLAAAVPMTYQTEITGGTTNLVFTTPKRLRFTAVGGGKYGSSFYLDNVHFYDSDALKDESTLATEPFNPEVVEAEDLFAADTTTVSQNLDFNDEIAGQPSNYILQCPVSNVNNKSEIEAFPSQANKSYMIYKALNTGTTAPYVDFSMDTKNAEFTVIEFDVFMKLFAYNNIPDTSYFRISMIDDARTDNDLSSLGISENGAWISCGGKGKDFARDKWHHIKIVLNHREMRTESFSVDNEVLATNVPWSNLTQDHPTSIRIHVRGDWTKNEAKMNIDNMRIYNGKDSKTESEWSKIGTGLGGGLIQQSKDILPLLSDAVVLMKESNHAAAKGTKSKLVQAAADIDGVTYVPAVYTAESLGGSVTDSGNTMTVRIGGGSKTFTSGQDMREKNGIAMIPLAAIANLLPSAKVTDSKELSMVLIDQQGLPLTKQQIQDIFDYTMYTRPSIATMKQDYTNTSNGQHPRILATADTFERILKAKDTDATMQQWYDDVMAEADEILAGNHTPATDLIGSLSETRIVLRRAYTLGMAYQLTRNTKYAAWMAEEMRIVCNFTDWYEKQTALIMGEMAAAAAFAYDWFYDYLSTQATDVKSMIEQAVYDHVLIGAKNCYDLREGTSTRWVTNEDNINIVVNSGTALAAIAMLDVSPDLAWEIMGRAVQSIENGLIGYVPDGVWKEGPSYWSYTTGYFSWMMAAMETAFGTDYGYLSENPFPQKTGYYNFFMQSARGKNNVGDAGGEIENCEEVFYLAHVTNDKDLTALRLNDMKAYGIKGSAMDLIFYDSTLRIDTPKVGLDQLFGDMAIFRDSYSTLEPTYATLHGGYNNGTHTHVDAGTFLLDMFNRRWAGEMGPDEYEQPNYWHPTKHAYLYKLNPQCQNVIAMNPTAEIGQVLEATANFTQFKTGSDGGFAVVDMTNVYGARVKDAKRAIKMDHNRSQIVIQDEIDFRARKTDLYWFMYTFLGYTISEDGKSVLLTYGPGQEDKVLMVMSCSDPSAKFERSTPTPLPESGVKPSVQGINGSSRLQIHIPDAGGKLNLSVRFIPVPDADNADLDTLLKEAEPMTPINEWAVES